MSSEFQPEVTPTPPPVNETVVGYCRACGKALTPSTLRNAAGTIYCEEHAPAPVSAHGSGAHAAGQVPPPMPPGSAPRPTAETYPANPYAGPPPVPHSDASPGVAFVLGLIPGVGAIYNGQYAKGVVHALIFILIIAIVNSDTGPGALGLMIPVFIFYMAFEAYHTARRRRAGILTDDFSGILPSRESQFPVAAVLLIAFGTLFLLDNLNIFRLSDVIEYWPVVLIAMGVYMLVARASSARDAAKHDDNGAGQ